MFDLALAVGIADTLEEAGCSESLLDAHEAASELLALYPKAGASFDDVVEALTD